MNKVVRDNYPVERLPEDLQDTLDPSRPAIVTVEQPVERNLAADRFSDVHGELVERFRSFRESLETERRGLPTMRLAELGARLPRLHGDERQVVSQIRAMRDEE